MISEDITLDSRVHARIIGARGKGIRRIMDEFKVSFCFVLFILIDLIFFFRLKLTKEYINVYGQKQVIHFKLVTMQEKRG